jgi:hypothetical protein
MESEASLSCSQKQVTGSYPNPVESIPHTIWSQILILPSNLCVGLPSGLPTKILFALHAPHPSHPSWFKYHSDNVSYKVPVLLTEHRTMKTYWGSGGIAPHILELSTRWRWVVTFTLRSLYPQGKSPCYPLDRRLGGLQSRCGRGGKEKNLQPLPGLQPPII